MTLPFYKLQIAGNGFILFDLLPLPESLKAKSALHPDNRNTIARRICDRRFGVGASGCMFLEKDNTLTFYSAQGIPAGNSDDSLLCAARYAFDSGRSNGQKILFKDGKQNTMRVDILGANDFRISCGAPFSLLKETVITPESKDVNEVIESGGLECVYGAVHLHENVIVASPGNRGFFSFQDFAVLVHKAFPKKKVLPVIATPVTENTVLVKSNPKGMSGACSTAAAALCVSCCAGTTEFESMVMFEQRGDDGLPDNMLAKDTDSSRRIAVYWDYKEKERNEIYVSGSGAYVFEGKFDIPE